MSYLSKQFSASVVNVLSGDDMVVLLDLEAEGLFKKQRLRLRGVDTPSALNQGNETEAGTLRTEIFGILKGKELRIVVHNRGAASWVADVYYREGTREVHLNKALVDMGYEYMRGEHGHDTTTRQ